MISIITACYNSGATIKRTIESVLNQDSLSDIQIEHIFVDGASKDNTLSIIEGYRTAYEQKGMRMIVNSEKDEGIYDAMNKGISLSAGKIIGILNSDDWYEPNTISVVQKAFNNNMKADIIMGAIYLHNGKQTIIKRAKKSWIITSRHFNHPAMFVRSDCYQDVGTYENSSISGDFDWYLRAMRKGKNVILIPNILTHFSVGGASTKKSFPGAIKKIGDRYKVYRKNGYSCLYYFECAFQELAKYCLIRE